MSIFHSLLLPVRSRHAAGPAIQAAAEFSERLGARLVVEEFDREHFCERVLDSVEEISADLIVLCRSQIFGLCAQKLIHLSPLPILVLPERGSLDWSSVLVPMSGEVRRNAALEAALILARDMAIPVDVIHVVSPAGSPCMIECFSDDAHHDYPGRFDEFLAQAAPFASAHEKSVIRDVRLVVGEIAEEILRHSETRHTGFVIVEWHWRMSRGRAATLRHMLRTSQSPLLLVRPSPDVHFELRIG